MGPAPEIDETYLKAILAQSLRPDVCAVFGNKLRIVYSPPHGAGAALELEALRRWGFDKVILCESQRELDSAFPTAASLESALRAAAEDALKTARANNADLVLAADGDHGRVVVAVKHGGAYETLTSSQVAALLVDYVLRSRADQEGIPSNAVVKTVALSSPETIQARDTLAC